MEKYNFSGFLSEESVALHMEYLKELNLKYSVLVKSVPSLFGKELSDIAGMKLPKDIKREAVEILSKIVSHEVYFSSFTKAVVPCRGIKRYYSSEAAFVYDVLCCARSHDSGFVYVFVRDNGAPSIVHSSELKILTERPVLCLDTFEHAYFLDYRFMRDEYLKRAAAHLDLSKITSHT